MPMFYYVSGVYCYLYFDQMHVNLIWYLYPFMLNKICLSLSLNKTFRYGHNVLFTYHIMDFTATEDSTTWHYWPHKHSVSFSSTILQPDNISLQYNEGACLGLPINELNLTKWWSHIFHNHLPIKMKHLLIAGIQWLDAGFLRTLLNTWVPVINIGWHCNAE